MVDNLRKAHFEMKSRVEELERSQSEATQEVQKLQDQVKVANTEKYWAEDSRDEANALA